MKPNWIFSLTLQKYQIRHKVTTSAQQCSVIVLFAECTTMNFKTGWYLFPPTTIGFTDEPRENVELMNVLECNKSSGAVRLECKPNEKSEDDVTFPRAFDSHLINGRLRPSIESPFSLVAIEFRHLRTFVVFKMSWLFYLLKNIF